MKRKNHYLDHVNGKKNEIQRPTRNKCECEREFSARVCATVQRMIVFNLINWFIATHLLPLRSGFFSSLLLLYQSAGDGFHNGHEESGCEFGACKINKRLALAIPVFHNGS